MVMIGDRVLVKVEEGSQVTEYGIYLPEAVQQKATQGKVISIGGTVSKNEDIFVGHDVLFQDNTGTEIKLDGIPHLIIKEKNILAVIAKE